MSFNNFIPNGAINLKIVKDSMKNKKIKYRDLGIDSSQVFMVENKCKNKSIDPKRRDKYGEKSQ